MLCAGSTLPPHSVPVLVVDRNPFDRLVAQNNAEREHGRLNETRREPLEEHVHSLLFPQQRERGTYRVEALNLFGFAQFLH